MNQERLLKIILSPHVSEKATVATEAHNQYVFKVLPSATKPEIKDAVEQIFKTKVKDVRILNMKTKEKKFRGMGGKRKRWKKAYISLQSGENLAIVEK